MRIGLGSVPAHHLVPVQSNKDSEITVVQTTAMSLLKLVTFLQTTGEAGELGHPVQQLARAKEVEIDLIFAITEKTPMLKFAASQVIGDFGLHGPHALKPALEAPNQDQGSTNAPTRYKLRHKHVEIQDHGVNGTTGPLVLCHVVAELKHDLVFTPALLLIRL